MMATRSLLAFVCLLVAPAGCLAQYELCANSEISRVCFGDNVGTLKKFVQEKLGTTCIQYPTITHTSSTVTTATETATTTTETTSTTTTKTTFTTTTFSTITSTSTIAGETTTVPGTVTTSTTTTATTLTTTTKTTSTRTTTTTKTTKTVTTVTATAVKANEFGRYCLEDCILCKEGCEGSGSIDFCFNACEKFIAVLEPPSTVAPSAQTTQAQGTTTTQPQGGGGSQTTSAAGVVVTEDGLEGSFNTTTEIPAAGSGGGSDDGAGVTVLTDAPVGSWMCDASNDCHTILDDSMQAIYDSIDCVRNVLIVNECRNTNYGQTTWDDTKQTQYDVFRFLETDCKYSKVDPFDFLPSKAELAQEISQTVMDLEANGCGENPNTDTCAELFATRDFLVANLAVGATTRIPTTILRLADEVEGDSASSVVTGSVTAVSIVVSMLATSVLGCF